jgi:allantoinase
MTLADHHRYAQRPINRRPIFEWIEGRRLAVYVALNLEAYGFGEGLVEELVPGGPPPDVLNYSWRDYGNRVGAWRLLEMFDSLGLPCAALVNSALYATMPELPGAFRARGDEIVCHGRTNSERQGELEEAAERALIREATETLARHEARPPHGWLGPWISESRVTPDLLQECGYKYLLDWCSDDQPVWFRTRGGHILSIPYPQELNDSNAIVARRMGAEAFAEMIVDNFDEMLEQAAAGPPLVMGIALHAYIVGQPFRLRHLRRALRHLQATGGKVWITHPGAIAARYAEVIAP